MAVAETAVSHGKSASGESSGLSGAGLVKAVFNLTIGASLVFLCGLLSPNAEAQIVADHSAPGNQQPTILQTASGLPQVNIQTPSAAGVSRNTYSQFDVGAKGVILNNSRTDTSSQIGGLVQANPWLATGSARVILNEVNSANPSQIKGYVEVAGQRAEVIIANPAGISVNGGGFLNASAVTLTTGSAVMNAGSLDSFRVRGGVISIEGNGLDTSTVDYTNILARAAQVNAGTSSDLLSSSTTSVKASASSATALATTLTGKNVSVQAGNNVVSVGSQFKGNTIDVGGANQTLLYATQDSSQISSETHTTTTAGLGLSVFNETLSDKTTTDSKSQSTAVGTKLVGTERIQIGVGNKTELQGTEVSAQQIAFVKTNPNGAGELILSGSTNATQTSHTEKTETLGLYQEAKGAGSTVQTLNQTTLKGNVSFDAGLKITAQVPKDIQATPGGQALSAQVQTLQGTLGSSSSGLEYLNQLAANPNVKWDKIALANEKWSYDQAGLTPAGAALLSIAIAAYTGGLGAEMLGGTTATAATATTAATSATLAGSASLATAVNAGFASLASQAAVAMVNNGGDIGKTLAQLGSEQSIKGLLTTMATAGALQQLGSTAMFNGQSGTAAAGTNGLTTAQTAATFGDKLLKNITNNLAGSAIDSVINGRAFDEKALGNALTNALITTGLASGAGAIGDARVDGNAATGTASTLNDFTNKIAHAVLGCAGGAATGGGCGAGAVGAVIGELTAEYATNAGMSKDNALALAKTLSAASGVLVGGGGDNAAAVNAAATTGANAAENNYLKHAEAIKLGNLKQKLANCAADSNCDGNGTTKVQIQQQIAGLVAIDSLTNADLASACSGPNASDAACKAQRKDALTASQSYKGTGSTDSMAVQLYSTDAFLKAGMPTPSEQAANGKVLQNVAVGALATGAIVLAPEALASGEAVTALQAGAAGGISALINIGATVTKEGSDTLTKLSTYSDAAAAFVSGAVTLGKGVAATALINVGTGASANAAKGDEITTTSVLKDAVVGAMSAKAATAGDTAAAKIAGGKDSPSQLGAGVAATATEFMNWVFDLTKKIVAPSAGKKE